MTPPPVTTTALLTDHYELTMLQAALADGTAHRRSVFELFPRRLPEGRRYGVVAGVGRASTRSRRSGSTTRRSPSSRASSTTTRWTGWRLPLHRRRLGLRRGRGLLPLLAAAGRRVDVRRGGPARDRAAVDLQPRLGDRLGGLPDDAGGRRPAVHRDGLAAHPRGGRGRAARAAYVAGFATTSNLAARAAVRRPDRRAPARTASRCCTTPRRTRSAPRSSRWARAPPCWSTPTTSREAVRARGRGRRHRAGRGPARLRRPRRARPRGPRPARRPRRHRDPDHRHQRPRRVRHRRARRRPVDGYGVGTQLVTGSGHPTCGFVYKLVAARAPTARWCRSPRRATDKISIGGRKYALRRRDRAGVAEAEVIGIGTPPDGRRRRPRRCSSRWSVTARSSAASPSTPAQRHRAVAPSCPLGAQQMSKGEPVIPTIHPRGHLRG